MKEYDEYLFFDYEGYLDQMVALFNQKYVHSVIKK